VRIEERLALERPGAVLEPAEEAAAPAGVAGRAAALVDAHHDDVTVAVDPQAAHALRVAALLALVPDAPLRAAPVVDLARLERAAQRLLAHVRDHQHVAARVVDRDRDDEAVALREVDLGEGVHGGAEATRSPARTPDARAAPGARRSADRAPGRARPRRLA